MPHVTERAPAGAGRRSETDPETDPETEPETGADTGAGLLPGARPIDATDEQLAQVRYTADGLVPAIVQDGSDGAVLMLGWMSEATLRQTLAEGRTVFWSRSRQQVWRKGETSGDVQLVQRAYYDCDGDVLLLVVDQAGGGACHTGERTCFYRAFGPVEAGPTDTTPTDAAPPDTKRSR